jgi:hypothetical protein
MCSPPSAGPPVHAESLTAPSGSRRPPSNAAAVTFSATQALPLQRVAWFKTTKASLDQPRLDFFSVAPSYVEGVGDSAVAREAVDGTSGGGQMLAGRRRWRDAAGEGRRPAPYTHGVACSGRLQAAPALVVRGGGRVWLARAGSAALRLRLAGARAAIGSSEARTNPRRFPEVSAR